MFVYGQNKYTQVCEYYPSIVFFVLSRYHVLSRLLLYIHFLSFVLQPVQLRH